MRILVAEDEPHLNEVITKKLRAEHYSVDACFNGEEALDYMEAAEYDAVVLDIMMPVIDGLEVLQQMRSRNDKTPVLLLTAKDSIQDRVLGLDQGADDYLIKPFSFDELCARIRVLLRHATDHVSNRFACADLIVDCDTHEVYRNTLPINLSSKEFSILEYMIRNQGLVLSREKIEQHIWNYDYEGGSNVIDVYIRYLRKKIDDSFEPKLIHTIRGVGYVLKENI